MAILALLSEQKCVKTFVRQYIESVKAAKNSALRTGGKNEERGDGL